MTSPALGVGFHRTFPAPLVIGFAEQVERFGLDDLWVIEDCFFTGVFRSLPLPSRELSG